MAIKRSGASSPNSHITSESDPIRSESEAGIAAQQPIQSISAAQLSYGKSNGSQPLLKSLYNRLRSGTSITDPLTPKVSDKVQHPEEKSSQSASSVAIRNDTSAPAEPVTPVRPVDHEKSGWISPNYRTSRSVKLNPQLLAENRCVGYQHEASELEYYRMLRTHILQKTGEKGHTIMVTSAGPGEGKTLTAINLAFTFAREYSQTALLVDCDLKRQQIHERLGFPSDKGLVDYLIDDAPFSDLIVWPGVEKLTVISGGKTVKDSSELLGSLGMRNIVTEMKHRYTDRYVIFDAPSLLTCADSLAFAPLVDYILIVVQAGKTSHHDVSRAIKLLPSEKILGLVMNRQQNLM